MKVLKEFREFAMKGSVVDLAVGVIIGASFGKVIASLVADIIMPPISLLLGGADFVNKFVSLRGPHLATLAESKAAGAITWNYGMFLNTVLEFFIVAFAVFLLIKQINRMRRTAPASTRGCPECLSDIPRAATRCRACATAVTPV